MPREQTTWSISERNEARTTEATGWKEAGVAGATGWKEAGVAGATERDTRGFDISFKYENLTNNLYLVYVIQSDETFKVANNCFKE